MKNLRILHVIPSLDPSHGGPSRSVGGLARAQTEFADSVQVVAGGRPNAYASDRENLELISYPLLPVRFSIPGRALYQQLRSSIFEADLVHVHSIWNGTTTCAARLCRSMGKPMVLSPRGMLDRHNMRRRARLKRAYLIAEKSNLDSMSAFHFLDDTEREGCRWLQAIERVPCFVQPNGLHLSQLRDQLAEAPEGQLNRRVSEPSARHLVFLGRLNVIKGLDLQVRLLPELISKGINVHLHLIGPDDGEGKVIEKLASELGITDRVHQHGPVYGNQRLRLLQEADAVLLTSHYECNSVTASETLAVGGILVAADTCHLDRPASEHAAIVVPRDIGSLSDALCEVLVDDTKSMETRRRAVEFAGRFLDWHVLAKEMVNFYEQLIQEHCRCVG